MYNLNQPTNKNNLTKNNNQPPKIPQQTQNPLEKFNSQFELVEKFSKHIKNSKINTNNLGHRVKLQIGDPELITALHKN